MKTVVVITSSTTYNPYRQALDSDNVNPSG